MAKFAFEDGDLTYRGSLLWPSFTPRITESLRPWASEHAHLFVMVPDSTCPFIVAIDNNRVVITQSLLVRSNFRHNTL
jgi:hypothetical protein